MIGSASQLCFHIHLAKGLLIVGFTVWLACFLWKTPVSLSFRLDIIYRLIIIKNIFHFFSGPLFSWSSLFSIPFEQFWGAWVAQ